MKFSVLSGWRWCPYFTAYLDGDVSIRKMTNIKKHVEKTIARYSLVFPQPPEAFYARIYRDSKPRFLGDAGEKALGLAESKVRKNKMRYDI